LEIDRLLYRISSAAQLSALPFGGNYTMHDTVKVWYSREQIGQRQEE
jgi:hypothetical protein